MVELKQDERLDDLERNGYKIIQNPNKFCFGMDAVLLSGFAQVKPGERALDMGTGTGIIPILLEAKTKGEHFTGLEIQAESADMARRSVAYNHLEERVDIVTGDIRTASELFPKSSFDVITSNPPYMNHMHGIQNPEAPKALHATKYSVHWRIWSGKQAGFCGPADGFTSFTGPFVWSKYSRH